MKKNYYEMTAAIAGLRSWKGHATEVCQTYFYNGKRNKIEIHARVFYNDDLIARCYLFEKRIVFYLYPNADSGYFRRINAILSEFTAGAYRMPVRHGVPVLEQKAPSEWKVETDKSYFYI